MCAFRSLVVVLVTAATLVAAGSAAAGDELDRSPGPATLGDGTSLLYSDCYEHLGRFALPIATIGVDLPDDFQYLPAGPGMAPVNVVGLDCRLGDERVVDVFIAAPVMAPPGFTPQGVRASLLAVRRYTSRPRAATRLAQWCFGDVVSRGDVSAEDDTFADGSRSGSVTVEDGPRSIELHTTMPSTTIPGNVMPEAAAIIQHFTVNAGEVLGKLVFAAGPGTRAINGTARLVLDGVEFSGFGAHVYPNPAADAFDFTYTGLTFCPPGLG